MTSNSEPALRFLDIEGHRYLIPERVLQMHVLPRDLPEAMPLTGLEDAPAAAPVGMAVPVQWRIVRTDDAESLRYVIDPPLMIEDGVVEKKSNGSERGEEHASATRVSQHDRMTTVTVVLPPGCIRIRSVVAVVGPRCVAAREGTGR